MNPSLSSIAIAAALLFLWAPAAGAEEARPNIIVLLADDLGWRDVGYHDSEIHTPNIDRIAREGIELDRFYVQPSCNPTRAGLMTGKSPLRLGIDRPLSKNEETGLPLNEKILPQYLAEQGYETAMVGKWHLGHFTPDLFPHERGFEHFYGHVTGGIGYWDHNHGGGHDWQRNGETVREEGYSTTLIADEAIGLLQNRDPARPLFLYVAFNAPHTPNEAPPEALARYAALEEGRRTHAAMVDELDRAIGRVLDTVAQEGMADDTLVFFSSDNGGLDREAQPAAIRGGVEFLVSVFGRPLPTRGLEFLASNVLDGESDNRPLPGGKMSVAEGGVRVPAAVWWPGHLEGGRYEGFMTISDVLPTLLSAVDAEDATPRNLDGVSHWATLMGTRASAQSPDFVTTGLDGMAIYRAPWKLVDPDDPRLYDVYADPLETRDVAAEHPDIVASLTERARTWPRGPVLGTSFLSIFLDPDTFGGPEDRDPWADVARDRAARGG